METLVLHGSLGGHTLADLPTRRDGGRLALSAPELHMNVSLEQVRWQLQVCIRELCVYACITLHQYEATSP